MRTYARWNQPQYGPVLSRVLEEVLRPKASAGEEEVVDATWTPVVDVKETDDSLALYVELPGVDKDEIEISLESGVLTVSGERHFDEEEKDHYRRVERTYGKFHRSFRVPRDVDGTKVAASYDRGVLTLELPKTEAAKPRQIQIN